MSIDDATGPISEQRPKRWTKALARQHGALCTARYYAAKLTLIGGEKIAFAHSMKWLTLCLHAGKYLVRGQVRCGRHTPAALRTRGRAL
jgi:hypothetical protein